MTLSHAQLTPEADRRYEIVKVLEIPEKVDLRRLLRLCHDNDELPPDSPGVATYTQLNLRELLRGRVLDAFIAEDRLVRLQWHGAITAFILRGANAARASRIAKCQERRLREWGDKFLAFAADWLEATEERRIHRERTRDEDYQRRLSACELICGRKSFAGGGCNLNDWTGCKLCPLLALP